MAGKRAEKGLTISDLAQKLGVSSAEVERWESGGELPDSEYLLLLSSLLGVTVEEILRADDAARDGEARPSPPRDGEESTDTGAFSDGGAAAREERGGPLSPSAQETVQFAFSDGAAAQKARKRQNGFSDGERIFGYIVCALFVLTFAITFAVQLAGWMQRPRELTMENYREYIEIDVFPTEHFNPQDYVVQITAKENIADLRLSVRVDFWGMNGTEDFSETVLLEQSFIKEGDTAERGFRISTFMAYNHRFKVLSVGGELE